MMKLTEKVGVLGLSGNKENPPKVGKRNGTWGCGKVGIS